MAQIDRRLPGNIRDWRAKIKEGIMNGSVSATLEGASDYEINGGQCSVLVFERYSYIGKNRLSMSVTLLDGGDGEVHLCAITSGGSSAMFFKINTFGENAFLKKLSEIIG